MMDGKIQGISYELDGVAFPGHKLGKAYSWGGLIERGIENLELPPQPTPQVRPQVKKGSLTI